MGRANLIGLIVEKLSSSKAHTQLLLLCTTVDHLSIVVSDEMELLTCQQQ